MDWITLLLGFILVCITGCSDGQNSANGGVQNPADTNTYYSLTVTVGNGTAVITPDLTSYAAGTSVTMAITPDGGFVFYAWPGDHSGMENPLVVTLDRDRTIAAACVSVQDQNYCTDSNKVLFEILSPAGSSGAVSTILKKMSIHRC